MTFTRGNVGGYNTLSARFRLSLRESWRFCWAMNAGRSGLYARVGRGLGLEKGRWVRSRREECVEGQAEKSATRKRDGNRETEEWKRPMEGNLMCTCIYVCIRCSGKREEQRRRTAARAITQRRAAPGRRKIERERASETREAETRIERVDKRAQGREAERNERSKAFVQRQCAMSNHRLSHSTRHWHTTTALQPTPSSSSITYSFDTQPRTRIRSPTLRASAHEKLVTHRL